MKKMFGKKLAFLLAAAVLAAGAFTSCSDGSDSGSGDGGKGSGNNQSGYLRIENNIVTGIVLSKIPEDGAFVIPDGVEGFDQQWKLDEDSYEWLEDDKIKSISLPASIKNTNHIIPVAASTIDIIYRGTLADWCALEKSSLLQNPIVKSITIGETDLMTMTELVIPDGVTKICGGAFSCAEKLTSVTIPSSVKEIGSNAFWSLSYPTVTYKGTLAEWCEIEDSSSLYFSKSIKIGETDLKTMTEITAKDIDGAKRITSGTFSCTELTRVEIPESVTEISGSSFYMCNNLSSVKFTTTDGWYTKSDFSGTPVDVEDDSKNAEYLKSWNSTGLYRKTN